MGSGGPGSTEERESVRAEAIPLESIESVVKADSIERTKTWAGIILCYVTIGLIGLESFIMIVYFFSATYSLKSLAQPLTQESLQIYKEARGVVVDDVLKIGNLFLGSVLLPILTLLLGYIFGSRAGKAELEETEGGD